MIKHVWLDFSDTIGWIDREKFDALKYAEYARLKGVPVDESIKTEYEQIFHELGFANANVFVKAFGKPPSYWSDYINGHPEVYTLAEPIIPDMINKISELVPVSVFSNIHTESVMNQLGIDVSKFTHIFSAATLQYPKPHPEGYETIIKMSGLPPDEILYVGDNVKKDIIPANKVGLKTGFIWGKCPEADYEFSSFRDIYELIAHQ